MAYSRMTKGGQRVRSDIMEKYVNAGECTVFASAISPLSVVPLLQLDLEVETQSHDIQIYMER